MFFQSVGIAVKYQRPSVFSGIAIELIERDRQTPGGVQIYISPKPTNYALGRPSVTFAAMLGAGAPDLAFANVLGSNNFNVAILALLPAGGAPRERAGPRRAGSLLRPGR